jgi:trimeric autotransporter adhesin
MTLRMDRGTRFPTLLYSCVLATCIHACATPRVITVAGGSLGNWKSATSASFGSPGDVVPDAKGNLYVSDQINCRIRKITVKGAVSTFAGTGICGYGGDGGPATSAMLATPSSLVFDSAGNLLIADSGNSRIRKVSVARTITTFAGNGINGYSGDGGPATAASLYDPNGVSVDPSGNVYIGDTLNHVIRMVDGAGNIHTVAGNHKSGFSGDGGPATSAELSYPQGAISDGTGNLFIADNDNDRVRRVDSSGTITTYAGGASRQGGSGGPATSAFIGPPVGLFLAQSQLYISTYSGIWSVDSATQIITFVAGSLQGVSGFNGDGQVALSTLFSAIEGIAMDKAGDLLVADAGNGRIRKIGVDQFVSTVAGGYIGDGGPAIQASLSLGFWDHASFDSAGNLYIADYYNNRLRRVSTTGIISTFAGNGMTGPPQDNVQATTTFIKPSAVVVDPGGNVFIADGNSARIRKVDSSGTITTFSNLFVSFSASLATDASGNLYLADGISSVLKIDPSGSATIIAGQSYPGYNGNGIAATTALLNQPNGLALDNGGNIYISDSGNNRIRKVDSSGIISTVAGDGGVGFSGDGGLATAATLYEPSDVAVDTKGNIYIADRNNFRVRKVDTSGTIQTLAGNGGFGYNGNGLPALSTNLYPSGVSVSPEGVVYVVDEGSYRVRKIR